MSASDLLTHRFRNSRDNLLLVTADGRSLTYGQALSNAMRLAAGWSEMGVQKGDSIALVMSNDIGFPCCYLACMIAGLIAVPINLELGKEAINFILNLARPKVVIEAVPLIDYTCTPSSEFSFPTDPNACGAIFFTSGTTGTPKGVCHSWSALVNNVASFNASMKIDASTRMYHVLPMAYMAGFLNTMLSPMVAGGAIVIGRRLTPETALDFWTLPVRERVNAIWMTPSIAAALARLVRDRMKAREAATGIGTILCGTAPLHPTVRQKFYELFGVPLQESYGTSELLLVSAQTRARAELMVADVGQPLSELTLTFRRDQDGRDELVIRSPFAALSYLSENGLAAISESDGFVPTGDVGKLEDGFLHITGRIKDLIIRGGVNISPRAVENVLGDLPGVEDVAVVGIPHEFWGEELVACVQASAEVDPVALEAAIRRRCRERLARSYQPDRVAILPTFPRAVTGKVQKGILQRNLKG